MIIRKRFRAYEPVFACRSLPAKSTRFSLAALMCSSPLSSVSQHSKCIVKMEWLREESAFINVAPVERFFQPRSITRSQSVTFLHGCIDSPMITQQWIRITLTTAENYAELNTVYTTDMHETVIVIILCSQFQSFVKGEVSSKMTYIFIGQFSG